MLIASSNSKPMIRTHIPKSSLSLLADMPTGTAMTARSSVDSVMKSIFLSKFKGLWMGSTNSNLIAVSEKIHNS